MKYVFSAYSNAQLPRMMKLGLQVLYRSMAVLSLNSSYVKYWLCCWACRKGLMLVTSSLVWLWAWHSSHPYAGPQGYQPAASLLLFGKIPLWASEPAASLSLLMEIWRQGCAVACRGSHGRTLPEPLLETALLYARRAGSIAVSQRARVLWRWC